MIVNSNAGIAACEFCSLAAFVLKWGVIAYVVFWLGHSGWWFLLPACIGGWNCKYITQPYGET